MSKHVRNVWPVVALVLAAAAAGAGAQAPAKNLTEVTVTGMGMDKDEALRDAMRKAVEKGAGTFIYSQSETRDFVLVRDTVLARAAGFIQSHKVVSARQVADGSWEVKITAVVSIRGVVDTWGVVTNMLKRMGRPKIMVFISEKITGVRVQRPGGPIRGLTVQVASSTVQTRIENLLLKSGFLLVNREQLKEIDKKDLTAAAAEDNPARIQAIAKRFGAQLFISGVANATAGEFKRISGIPIYAYQAEANVKCYRSDTAQLLSSIPGQSTRGADRVWRSAANKALDLQAKRVAPKVRSDILRFWQDALSGRGEVQLHVEGLSFKQYMQLKKTLETIKQVKDVTAKYHNKNAECSIESDVNAETLAEKLAEAFEKLEITDVSQNVIKAKFSQ